MKRILLFLTIAFTLNMCYAQDLNGKYYANSDVDANGQGFAALASPNKDTLWLSNDPTSKMIESVWNMPENKDEKSVIIYTSVAAILTMRQNPRYLKG